MENESKFNITPINGEQVIIIREGEAQPIHDPVKLNISGNIDTVHRFIEKRVALINQKQCHIKVSRSKKNASLHLVINETDHFSGSVTGTLSLDENFIEFGINTGKKYTLRDLSDFIKMHRFCFDDKDQAMKLVADLRNFKAKVNKDMEKVQDNRGNNKILFDQVVDSNVPESFILNMPIFKGDVPRKFKVEINIIPRDADMDCMLESPEANDIVADEMEKIITFQLDNINKLAPNIVQIEV